MALVNQLLLDASNKLQAVAGKESHREALILLAFVMGRQTTSLSVSQNDEVSAEEHAKFAQAVDQRCLHQPISQIIGKREFWKHQFIVTPDVLDPRPDTETLIEIALSGVPFTRVLDLGTGSGCILLSLLGERLQATGVGIDASRDALAVAQQNANALSLADRCDLRIGDWCNGLSEKFDLIVSNPPYITETAMQELSQEVLNWEPRIALTPEGDGLDAYRQIASGAGALLQPNGHLLLEIGYDQAESVCAILEKKGYNAIQVFQDINNKDRVVGAKL